MNKIIFVVGLAKSGGAEKRAILISKLLKKNFDTKVFAFSGEKTNDIDYVFKPTYQEYKKQSFRKRIVALRNFIDQEKPDYIFSFVPHINFFVALALKSKRYRNIIHILSMVFHDFRGKSKVLLKYSIKHADCVYYQCNDQKELVPCKCDSFVLPNPIVVSNNKTKTECFKFMSVGRLEDQKDYSLQIRSFSKIVEKFQNATLDIYGSGSLKEELNKLIHNLCLDKCVFIHDYIDNIEKEYNSHDIFLFTSKKEGFPNALAEAMAHGLICFTTLFQTGCIDLIKPGETGYLCEERNDDKYSQLIISKLSDYESAKRVSDNARNFVAHYCDSNIFTSKLTHILEEFQNGKKD